ncbi:MAG TPA: ester cyclase [Pseudolysinimonas sp.]|nr:ester cyclase [Pseudolysinimonas sp.]
MSPSPDAMREWFADYLDAGNRHDLVRLRSLIAPDVRRAHLPSGADAWIDDLDALFAAFPDFRWKRITALVEGDRLAAQLRASGTHRGPFRGVAPTGRHVNVAEFAIYRVVNDRIVEYAGTADGLDLLAQLRA